MVMLLLCLLLDDPTIDGAIGRGLAPRSTDEEFVRRVTLDLGGAIPETIGGKVDRAALIDRLLSSPEYAQRMEEVLTVMLLERRGGEGVPEARWRTWLRKKLDVDAPWNETVRELLAADGRDPASQPAVKFFVDGRTDPHRVTQDVARLFLGRNLQCAQCHDHPHVKDWKQAEYMGLYAFVAQNKAHTDAKTKTAYFMEQPLLKKVDYENVFRPENKKATGPALAGAGELEVPSFPKGQEWEVPPAKDGLPGLPKFRPRERLAADLVAQPAFARTAVNRLWFLFMGRGLVHPIDFDHAKNSPSHPELLDALTRRFVAGGTRFKPLIREILLSEAYQRSGRLPEGVDPASVKPESYAAFLPRPLSPEQLARSVLRATGRLEAFSSAPPGKFNARNYLAGKDKVARPTTLADVVACFVEVFGSPAGEPETSFQVSTTHALYWRNDILITELAAGASGTVDQLYARILSRRPTDAERNAAKDVAPSTLAWALLASAEFRLNH